MSEMNDHPAAPNEKVEGVLRRWGAQEAARTTDVPPAPAGPMRQVGTMPAALRWAPLAAAAVLLLAAGWLFTASRRGPEPAGPAGPAALIEEVPMPTISTRPTSAPAQEDLDRLNEEKQALQQKLAQAATAVQRAKKAEAALTKLQSDLAAEREKQKQDVQALTARGKAREKKNQELLTKLTAAEKRLAALDKERQALQAAAAELPKAKIRLSALQTQLASATEEARQARKLQAAAVAAAAEAKRGVDLWKARRAELDLALQQVYLGAIAPGTEGLAARKAALSARRMLGRVAEVLSDVRSDSTRRLIGRLEVVLVRLGLLDAKRPGAREAFGKLLAGGKLPKQIDEALHAGDESQRVRAWLLEAKLILMGAGDVG